MELHSSERHRGEVRLAGEAERARGLAGPQIWRLAAGATVFWMGVALFAATASFVASRGEPGAPTWSGALASPLAAGILWVPLTLLAVQLARRYPPLATDGGLRPLPRALAIHAVVGLATSLLLNAGILAILRPEAVRSVSDFAEAAFRLGLGYVHINAGVYWAIVGVASVLPALKVRSAKPRPLEPEATLTVRTGTSQVRVRVADIVWFEGAGDYVRLHQRDTEHLLSERLKSLERRLDPARFVRVHRSAILNVDEVEKLRHVGHGDYEVTLRDGTHVRVARSRREMLRSALEAREAQLATGG